ncbi:MAG: glycosyltransferase family 39 protein [Flavobacteriales bacterium]|nr:glycosyltransferase family 39 protein [Flavobacteriales bacterium]
MRTLIQRLDRIALASPARSLLLILSIALVLAGARLASNPPTLHEDQTDNWWPVALNVLHGNGFRHCLPLYFPACGPGNDLSAMREPLPVLVYAGLAFGREDVWSVALFKVFLFLMILLLVHRLGRALGGERAGLMAALAWALYLPAVQVIPQVGGDLLATLGCTGAVLTFRHAQDRGRVRDWAVAGAILGAAVLCRTAVMALVVPLGLVLWRPWRGQGLRTRTAHAVVYGTAFLLLIAPWTLRNRAVFGEWVVGSTLTGYNLLRHNHHLGSEDLYRYIAADEAEPVTNAVVDRHPELGPHPNEAQVDAVYRAEGRAIVAAHRWEHIKLSLWRAVPLWTNWGVVQAYGEAWKPVDTVMLVMQVILLLLFLEDLVEEAATTWWMALLVLVFCATHMVVVCRMRYLLPVMPMVIALGARALDRHWRRALRV